MEVKFVHITPDAEKLIAYCARVSSENQDNPDYEKLLTYCAKRGHWSIFQMASLCVEVTTSRAISAQLLRHRSFNFQEFSQRYSAVNNFELYDPRKQDTKNRQNSTSDLNPEDVDWFLNAAIGVHTTAKCLYDEAIKRGVAKECARNLLPMSTRTKLYMHGTIRDFIHYCNVRCDKSTQLEHREIANAVWKIFEEKLPIVAKAVKEVYPNLVTS